ncbi:MAG: ABC transporter ATP-binding protein [Pseudomonadota bacterium]
MPIWAAHPMGDRAPLLVIDDLVAGYRPGLPIVNGVSLVVGEGEIVTVIGPNGAGKSTLIKGVAGLVRIESGTIRIGNRILNGTRPDRIGDFDIAYVLQTANIFTSLTVRENLALAARRCRAKPADRVEAMVELFPALGEKLTLRGRGLSGGQRQMLALAMALIAEPRLVLLDEPTAGLSPKAAQDVLALILSMAADGVSVLLIEQNAKMALGLSDRAIILADGRLQHEGDAKAMLTDPIVGEIYLGGKRRDAA